MFVSHWTRARLGCPVWIPGDRKKLWGGKCETAFKPCLNCSSQTVIVCTNIHSLWLLYQCHKIKSIFTWTQIPHSHWFQIFMQNLIQCPACTYFHYISQHLIWFATRYWRGPLYICFRWEKSLHPFTPAHLVYGEAPISASQLHCVLQSLYSTPYVVLDPCTHKTTVILLYPSVSFNAYSYYFYSQTWLEKIACSNSFTLEKSLFRLYWLQWTANSPLCCYLDINPINVLTCG